LQNTAVTDTEEKQLTTRPQRPAGWLYHQGKPVIEPLDHVTEIAGDPLLKLHMVFTRDGAYVPAVVGTPAGSGPFPAVMCLHGGSGGLGHSFLVDQMRSRGSLFDRLLVEGYLVCHTEGRMEREEAYVSRDAGVLDHEDVVEVFRYLQRLPEVDADRIGTFGVSHGGELQMKMISEMGTGPVAMIPTEPAVIEYLGLRHDASAREGWAVEDSSGPRVEEKLQFRGPVDDDQIDLSAAWQRIQAISPSVAVLVMGRDDDHLQGLFRKLHELLTRAGKHAEWATWDHPEHAYQWGPLRTANGYELDDIQKATLDHVADFLNRHVRDRNRRAAAV
jgi:predicted acyl esterase